MQNFVPWVQPVCLAGGANDRSKLPAKVNIHSVQIGFVNLSVASGETCNGSNNFVKKVQAFPQRHGLVAKNVSVCKERP